MSVILGAILISGCTQNPSSPVTQVPTAPVTTMTTQVIENVTNATTAATAATKAVTTSVTTATGPKQKLLLATTTSLYDTGLLDYLKPLFEKQYNVDLLITSQGTGKAIELAKRGDADVLLVHSPAQEDAFLADGNGINRRCIGTNYFIIVGPENDPAGIKGMKPDEAFKTLIAKGKKGDSGVMFISRGDGSGTHSAEQKIWTTAKYNYSNDIQKSGKWYIEAGKGMGETLQMASEKGAYTLTDEGTYLAYQGKLALKPIITTGDLLLNRYSVITVYNNKQPEAKINLANDFANFLISNETQTAIGNFGKDKYGKSLFTPMNGNCSAYNCDCSSPATAVKPLIINHAGSLDKPFAKLAESFKATHPDIDVQRYSMASSAAIEKVTKENKLADVVASAEANLIPKMMIPAYADQYVDFAKNKMVLAYSDKSKYASELTAENWFDVLAKPDLKVATTDPNNDPGGYRAMMVLQLAERASKIPNTFFAILGDDTGITRQNNNGQYVLDVSKIKANTSRYLMGGKELYQAVKDGKVDYFISYESTVNQNGLKYIDIGPSFDLSNTTYADIYKTVAVKRTASSGQQSTETGLPIIYGITVPLNAKNPESGLEFVKFVISPEGQQALASDKQPPIVPAIPHGNINLTLLSARV